MRLSTGRVFNSVYSLLKEQGVLDLSSLEVATLSRGPDHLVLLKGETVGEYNHVSGRLILYN